MRSTDMLNVCWIYVEASTLKFQHVFNIYRYSMYHIQLQCLFNNGHIYSTFIKCVIAGWYNIITQSPGYLLKVFSITDTFIQRLLPPPRRLCFHRRLSVCQSVFLFVNKISQEVMDGFSWNFVHRLLMVNGRDG